MLRPEEEVIEADEEEAKAMADFLGFMAARRRGSGARVWGWLGPPLKKAGQAKS